jgi:hypothetical protein
MIGDEDGIASRTRSRKKTASLVATKWDIPTTIIIQFITWINQDDLINLYQSNYMILLLMNLEMKIQFILFLKSVEGR